MQTILQFLERAGGWHPGLWLKIDNAHVHIWGICALLVILRFRRVRRLVNTDVTHLRVVYRGAAEDRGVEDRFQILSQLNEVLS